MRQGETQPLITTIVPTYRRPLLLQRALRSVLRQTYPHFQVCVYDNNSSDETPSVVSELAEADSRIKYHCHAENIGPLGNFIYGMEHITTPFYSFLSDDDVLLPEFYEAAVAGFEKWPEAVCSITRTIQIFWKGRIHDVPILRWKPGLYAPPEGMVEMLKHPQLDWTGVLFRRETIQLASGLDGDVGPQNDFDFLLRLAARYPIVVSSQIGALYVVYHGLYTSTLCFDFLWHGKQKMIRNLTEDERIPCEVRRYAEGILTNRLKRWLLLSAGFGNLARGNMKDALKAGEILKSDYHLRGQAHLLRALAWVCQYIRPAFYFLHVLYSLRLVLRERWGKGRRQLELEFGNFARYLNL